MDSIPMLLFDSVALLAPGTILTFTIAWLYPIPSILEASKDARIIAVLMLAYGVGHLLQALGVRVISKKVEHDILKAAWDKFAAKEVVTDYIVAMYKTLGTTPKEIEGQCLGPIHEQTPKRDSMVTASDFNRAMVVACIVIAIVLIYRMALPWPSVTLDRGVGLLLSVGSSWLFYTRYKHLRTYGAKAAFLAFAAYMADKAKGQN